MALSCFHYFTNFVFSNNIGTHTQKQQYQKQTQTKIHEKKNLFVFFKQQTKFVRETSEKISLLFSDFYCCCSFLLTSAIF